MAFSTHFQCGWDSYSTYGCLALRSVELICRVYRARLFSVTPDTTYQELAIYR